jgi:hypothetical protein
MHFVVRGAIVWQHHQRVFVLVFAQPLDVSRERLPLLTSHTAPSVTRTRRSRCLTMFSALMVPPLFGDFPENSGAPF